MNPSDPNPLYSDASQQVSNTLEFDQQVVQIADPLELKIPDEDLVRIVKERKERAEKFYEDRYNLKGRRHKNEIYRFGRQVSINEAQGKYKDYESRSSMNIIYEIEATLKPLAMSQLPDIIITPGGPEPERLQSAQDLTEVVDSQNKKREMRQTASLAFQHLPVYFTAVVKARWDPEKGKAGDYRFDVINPEYVVADNTATSTNVDDMSFVAQCWPQTAQELLMRFPKKKEEIRSELQMDGIQTGTDSTWKDLASEVKPWEIWFDWYRRKGDDQGLMKREDAISMNEPGIEWERVCAVLWLYGDIILDKKLDPNFDHEGTTKMMTQDDPMMQSSRRELTMDELMMSAVMGQDIPNVEQEQVYHNYFSRPHKPYYFFGYDQWGKIPYDETSRIEQNLRNQENLDTQNKTMLDQLKTRVKHIWGKDSGLRKEDVQRLDMDDPKMDVLVEGNPNDVHSSVTPERPDTAQFKAIGDTQSAMYGLAGANAVRGTVQSEVATTNQIAREADFTRSDDLVEDTINAFYEWMSGWQMQFIKLRYTDAHMVEILGAKGQTTYKRIHRDLVVDGMEVKIKASSTDKLKAQRNAMEAAKLGPPYTNPLDFFNDMDISDPEGRTERGMMLTLDPPGYFMKYVMGMDPSQVAPALNQGLPGPAGPPTPDGQTGAPGEQPVAQPSPADTSQVPAAPPEPSQPMNI